jgi:predicted acyltransferase
MILVNNPGSWSHIYSSLEHAAWHGVTPTDLVFPFFLFAVGNAMAFVMPRFEAAGDAVFWKKVIKRTLLILAIGLFLNWSPFVRYDGDQLVLKGWEWVNSNGEVTGIRILGVLQRIALCYFFASVIIYYAKARGAFLIGAILLLIYWALCILGNPIDPYSLAGWFGTAIDKAVLTEPHMYHGETLIGKAIAFDPEGLIHTLPGITQVIFGFLVGDYIQKRGKAIADDVTKVPVSGPYQMLTGLFVAAMALLFTGYCWSLSFPLNKKIWTSSYVVYTTGLATAILATLIYAIEIKSIRGWWTKFFDVFGKNPLFIFFLSGFLPRLVALIRIPNGFTNEGAVKYTSPFAWFYQNICAKVPGTPENGSLLYAVIMIFFYWSIVYWMDKKKIYIKV